MALELILFNIFVVLLLILDLRVFNRKSHEVQVKEALKLSAFWISLALIFNLFIFFWQGKTPAIEFFTAYIIEKSLSIDNLFVFLVIFNYFKVEKKHQHKALFWGVVGALIMRAIFILVGISLIHTFHFVIYILALFLLYVSLRIIFQKETEIHPEKNPLLKLSRKFFRISDTYSNGEFFIKERGKWIATPLFVVLIMIETTDVIFALDSIPAVLAITLDPFIAYTSNIFAVLGLRALYFALVQLIPRFIYLRYGIGVILGFVAIKMLISDFYKIPVEISLLVIIIILFICIYATPRQRRNK